MYITVITWSSVGPPRWPPAGFPPRPATAPPVRHDAFRTQQAPKSRQDPPGHPTWPQLGLPKRARIVKKSIPKWSKFEAAFWIEFGPQNRSKKDPKSDQKSIQNGPRGLLGGPWRAWWPPWARFFFGWRLGRHLGPS